jgi:hypothetical protein
VGSELFGTARLVAAHLALVGHQRGQGIRRSGRVESGQNTHNSTVRAKDTQNNAGNRRTDRYQGNKKTIHDDKPVLASTPFATDANLSLYPRLTPVSINN